MNQVSPATMVVYAHTSGGLRTPSLYSMQRLIVRNSKIVSVDLTLYYETLFPGEHREPMCVGRAWASRPEDQHLLWPSAV